MDSVEYSNFEIKRMARILLVSTSGFYKWRAAEQSGEVSPRQQRRDDLDAMIQVHHKESNGTSGGTAHKERSAWGRRAADHH